MIKTHDAIRAARALIGTPYGELDCIGLIVRVIRTAPGGVPGYRTAGTNTLWRSATASAKYRDLTWRQEGISGAQAGMLAFKRSGTDVHHVGLVTGDGTVIHSSSVKGRVVETALDGSWGLLAVHRYIEVAGDSVGKEETDMEAVLYQATVYTQSTCLNLRATPGGTKIGSLPRGATVDVLDVGNKAWWRVRYEGMTGYASGQYLARVVYGADSPGAQGAEGWQPGEHPPTTTLVRDDDVSIVLVGKRHVAED